jgi:hypothetical protein
VNDRNSGEAWSPIREVTLKARGVGVTGPSPLGFCHQRKADTVSSEDAAAALFRVWSKMSY